MSKNLQGSLLSLRKKVSKIQKILLPVALIAPLGTGMLLPAFVHAQSIIAAPDGTGTVVDSNNPNAPDNKIINISGGTLSGNGQNLFHSFEKFGLEFGEVAHFLSNPNIRNILGRVTGGQASVIDGLIRVIGSSPGSSNLFLMNPAGIIFGANASLNVPASFTATTATSIGFGSATGGLPPRWFHATGGNNYANLFGNPNVFAFATLQPAGIINTAPLSVSTGQNLSLLGGSVISTNQLSAPEGNIIVSAVPGDSWVRISQPGSPLSLEIQPLTANPSPTLPFIPPSLQQLLTNPDVGNATGVTVNPDGTIQLTGSGVAVVAGDVVANHITAQTAVLSAEENLTLVESQLTTAGNMQLLAQNIVQAWDSVENAVSVSAGGNLTLQGKQGINLQALNHPDSLFQTDGNLSLISDGAISANGKFASEGNFSILNLIGEPANFSSFTKFIVSIGGDFSADAYSGDALQIEADGQIKIGDISTTEGSILLTSPTLIELTGSSIASNGENITFDGPVNINSSSGTLTISNGEGTGDITFTNTLDGFNDLMLTAGSGDVTISSNIGDTTPLNSLNISGNNITFADYTGGSLQVVAQGNITGGLINIVIPSWQEGFETGNSTGWTTIGNTSIRDSAYGSNPVEGRYQAVVTSGTGSVSDSTLETFLQQPSRTLDTMGNGNVTEGSAMKTTFSARAGDVLKFQANFLTDELDQATVYGDFAFITLGSSSKLADRSATFLPTAVPGYDGETGYQTFTIEIPTTGRYTLGLGATDVADTIVNSAVLVDNISLTRTAVNQAVNLSAGENIKITAINAQGTADNPGATVNITAGGFFQTTGSFTDQNGINASISTADGTAGGAITIQHGGGPLNIPFTVGDATINGTTGAITTGAETIAPISVIPVPPEIYTQGNIQIITTAPLPPPPPQQPPSPPPPQQPHSPPPQQPIILLPPQITPPQLQVLAPPQEILYLQSLVCPIPAVPLEASADAITDPNSLNEIAQQQVGNSWRWDGALSAIVPSIAGLMNSSGGKLTINIREEIAQRQYPCDSEQLPHDEDSLKQLLTQLVSSSIGSEYVALVTIHFERVDDRQMVIVEVSKAPKPVYVQSLQGQVFYVQVDNTTQTLDPELAQHYIEKNWD